MPNVYKRKTFKKKRPLRKNTRKPRPLTRRKRMPGPFRNFVSNDPFKPTMSVKLTYAVNKTLASGLGGTCGVEKVYRLNSLFDPDLTDGGHQPYGYDQLTPLYRHYKVNGARVEVVFTDPSEDGMACVVQIRSPTNLYDLPLTSIGQCKEQPMTVIRGINNSGKQKLKISQYIPLSTVSGLTPLQFKADIDLFSALTTANPAMSPVVAIACASERANQGASIIGRITIVYYATLYDRVVQLQS